FNLGDVVLSLFQADTFQPSGRELAVQAAPDCQGDGFGGGQTTLEPSHIAVQVVMVDIVDHQVLHNPVDLPQVDHHSRIHIHRSADCDLELVVVAMVPRTCPEHLAIASGVPLWPGEDVTGCKRQSSGQADALGRGPVNTIESIQRWITSRLPPALRLAGGATASLMLAGCQPSTCPRCPLPN